MGLPERSAEHRLGKFGWEATFEPRRCLTFQIILPVVPFLTGNPVSFPCPHCPVVLPGGSRQMEVDEEHQKMSEVSEDGDRRAACPTPQAADKRLRSTAWIRLKNPPKDAFLQQPRLGGSDFFWKHEGASLRRLLR